jgi:anhydro-N-acetylmuramic acid kinase
MSLFIGMISGTSVDGVDCVLADITASACTLVAARTTPFPEHLQQRVRELIEATAPAWQLLGETDGMLGHHFADCALDILRETGTRVDDVVAIGHHGQTVHHQPDGPQPFTIQIGDPNIVAARTGITTIADFRRLDMAVGGQGAPLVPGFHDWLLRAPHEPRVVCNIGGIANITVLEPGQPTTGYDTGPGNTLLDAWHQRCRGAAFDADGAWGATGRIDRHLLDALLAEPYFSQSPPKSTGRERFNLPWLDRHLGAAGPALAEADVQATLAELTARSIVDAVHASAPDCRRLIVCGGGAHNAYLMARLRAAFGNLVETTSAHDVAPDWIEGLAFAWLAHARLNGIAGNVPTVTGARKTVMLGGIYSGVTVPDPARDRDTTP